MQRSRRRKLARLAARGRVDASPIERTRGSHPRIARELRGYLRRLVSFKRILTTEMERLREDEAARVTAEATRILLTDGDR